VRETVTTLECEARSGTPLPGPQATSGLFPD